MNIKAALPQIVITWSMSEISSTRFYNATFSVQIDQRLSATAGALDPFTVQSAEFVGATAQRHSTEKIVSPLGLSPEDKEMYATAILQTFDVCRQAIGSLLCLEQTITPGLEMKPINRYSHKGWARSRC
jgi:hypothetical protein